MAATACPAAAPLRLRSLARALAPAPGERTPGAPNPVVHGLVDPAVQPDAARPADQLGRGSPRPTHDEGRPLAPLAHPERSPGLGLYAAARRPYHVPAMQVIQDPGTLQSALRGPRRGGKRIGLVPTMGALHAGHGSLVAAARARCDVVVASVFVNPTQFGPAEDLEAYPRDADGDRRKLESWGCDILFMPRDTDMYPRGLDGVRIQPPAGLVSSLCGPRRPGHFAGVLTIVLKLLNLTRPDMAFFGQKDFQQWRVIQHMAEDLLTGVEIVRCPTVREPDGLAMSSRNAYLTPAERSRALALSRSLAAALALFRAGERSAARLRKGALDAWEAFNEGEADPPRLEYLEIVDASTLEPIAEIGGTAAEIGAGGRPREAGEKPGASGAEALAAIAARLGRARLIDNVLLAENSPDFGLLDLDRGTLFSRLA